MNVPLVAVVISAQPRAKRENPGCRYAHPTARATKTDPDGTSLVCAAEYSDAASGLLLRLLAPLRVRLKCFLRVKKPTASW
jgi:hypothetical protein